MSLVDAHTENVKRAWAEYLWQDEDHRGTKPKGMGREEHQEMFVDEWNVHHSPLSLSQALDLLDWTATRAEDHKGRSCQAQITWDSAFVPPGDTRFKVFLYGGRGPEFTNEDADSLLEAVLLAIDAIVDEHPEVVG